MFERKRKKMKFKAIVMFDEVSKTYGLPMFYVNEKVCERSVAAALRVPDAVRNPNHLIHTIKDQRFYIIGEYDDLSGVLTPFKEPSLAFLGSSFSLGD